MTSEQYYWFVRRQQLLKAWNNNAKRGCGVALHRSFHFEKPDVENRYLFSFSSDGNYDDGAIA